MISESQLRELLGLGCETKNLDFKESLNWDTATNDEKCELVRDILAFMNTQDGGNVVVGVQDKTLQLLGLAVGDFASFDTTRVNDFLQRYTDPPASCEVQKLILDGKSLVVIGIPEFNDVPIICKKDANSAKDPSRLLLKAGGLYIRTDKATTVLVPSAEAMRDLMNRALLRRGDQLIGTIEKLLRGKPALDEKNFEQYSKEVNEAHEFFKQSLPADFEKTGYWELTAMPDTYKLERIADITTLSKYLHEAEVSLRGWNFPQMGRETSSNFESGRQSYTVFPPYVEAHRAYQSGLFIWRGAYRENGPGFKNTYGRALSFVNVIYEITEMFVFLKRFYERAALESVVRVHIELHDIKDRPLVQTEGFPDSVAPGSQQHKLVIERDYLVSELRTSAEEIAIKVVQKIFEVFNWSNPDPNMIRGWQHKLLTRTF